MLRDLLRQKIRNAATELYGSVPPHFKVEIGRPGFADYQSNIAFLVAGEKPPAAAETIAQILRKDEELKASVADIKAEGGFINFFLTPKAITKELEATTSAFDKGMDVLSGKEVVVEFISANPTGELHIGHGRGAFYGDVLANVLSYCGAEVTREFYINDSRESNQVKELGKTARGMGETYRTPELDAHIGGIGNIPADDSEAGFALAGAVQRENARFITETLKIPFNIWYSEDENLRAGGRNDRMLEKLKEKGLTYEKEGAVWLKTSEYGDDEDRVVVRSDGTNSYFLSDIAYHDEKFSRGNDIVIDVWGADHHGHVKRMMAVKEMLGWEGEFRIFITQMVSLKEGGISKKLSKREGTAIPLRELVADVGLDVVRWFYGEKAITTHMEFDAELAREASEKNPAFYVQYAHARIHSIEEKAEQLPRKETTLLSTLKNPSARSLAMKIIAFQEVAALAALDYQTQRLTTYAYELAREFSQFYRDVRVVEGDTADAGALELARAAKAALAKTLSLLGISAPETM